MMIQPEATVIWREDGTPKVNPAPSSLSEAIEEMLRIFLFRLKDFFRIKQAEHVDVARINHFSAQLQLALIEAGLAPRKITTRCILKSDIERGNSTTLKIHIVAPDTTSERFNAILNQVGQLCNVAAWTSTQIEVRGTFKS